MKNIFKKYYKKKKRNEKKKINFGAPSYSNFKVFLKILAREFIMLHYNVIFFENEYKESRKTFFNLLVELAIVNSEPAIHAEEKQKRAMNINKNYNM